MSSTSSTSLMNLVSSKYEKLLERAEDDGDVTIIVGEELMAKAFKAHSLILKTQCPWFERAISKEWARENEEGDIIIHKPNITPSIFEIILKYLYCGKINDKAYSGKQLLDLLVAADELNLNEIFEYLQVHLLNSHKKWLLTNFFHAYEIVLKHQEFKILQKYFETVIDDEPDILFYSKDFNKMNKNLLIHLLERDDLVISEIDIWRKMIEWGIANSSNSKIFKTLINNWDEEDFKALKTTLDQCIQSIRFNNISFIDYYYEIKPYEKILSEQIGEEMYQYHMTSRISNPLPPRIGIINSTVITSMEAAIITTWVDKSIEPYRFPKIPYEFELLLRGSQDGFNNAMFRSRCVDKGSTIVVMRVSGSRQIIGGYNPEKWKTAEQNSSYNRRSVFISCTDSFIFSFNYEPVRSDVVSYITDSTKAIRYLSNEFTGPVFGDGDLVMTGNNFKTAKSCRCVKTSYKKSIMESTENFSVDEYEVFELVRKPLSLPAFTSNSY